MAVLSYIPALWAARLLEPLEKSLVYAQPGVVNRDYGGEIAAMGDKVHINTISDVTVSTYTRGMKLGDPEELHSADQELIIDQGDYFQFLVDDVDAAQARADFSATALRRAAYKMRDEVDGYVAALMAAAVPAISTIGTVAAPKTDLGTAGVFYDYLVDLGVYLDVNNVPADGRWCIVPPWAHALLRKSSDVFVPASAMGDEVKRNGVVGQAGGFDLYKSNNVPNTTATKYKIIAGTDYATSYADQIVDTQAFMAQNYFGDIVRGLHIYGSKVVYPSALAMLIANKPS